MSYGKEWLRKAHEETWRFWTLKRTIASIVGPILIALLWTIFKPWSGWGAIMQIAVISVLVFFALWIVIFFVSLIEAPSQLDTEKTEAHAEELKVQISLSAAGRG